MKRNEKITKIMTPSPVTVHFAQKVSAASKAMSDGGFHHVPVIDGARLVGILSSTDLLRVSYEYGVDPRTSEAVLDHTVSIASLMKADPVTLTAEQTVRDAVAVFAEGAFHALPVVDGNGDLLGMVTTTDIMRYVLEQY